MHRQAADLLGKRETGLEPTGRAMQVEGSYSKDRNGNMKTTQFTAKGMSKMGADRYMFSFKPNRDAEPVEISVADHFRDNVKKPLKNPSFPCVIVRVLSPHAHSHRMCSVPLECVLRGCWLLVCWWQWLLDCGEDRTPKGIISYLGTHRTHTIAETKTSGNRYGYYCLVFILLPGF